MRKFFIAFILLSVVTICSAEELVKISIALTQEAIDKINESGLSASEYIQARIDEKITVDKINQYQQEQLIEATQKATSFKDDLKNINFESTGENTQ